MKIKTAVVGIGNMGIHHLRNYYQNPNVELIGVVDNNRERVEKAQQLFPIKSYDNYKELVGRVDAVSIATPTSTHYNIAKFFLQQNIHVLLEKPISVEIDEATSLIEIASQRDSILAIGHIERFNPVTLELKQLLSEKKPVYIDIHRESPFDARIFDNDVVSDLMVHDIDLVYFLLNEPVKLVSAQGISVRSEKSDLVNVQLVSQSGVLINITTSRITEQKIRSWRIVMPEELIEADLLERKLHLTRRTSFGLEFTTPGLDHKYTQEQITAKVLVGNNEPLQMEIADFVHSIQNKRPPKVGGAEGLKALEMVKQIQSATSLNSVKKVIMA